MSSTLPWNPADTPLMLAPMQGLTNRALRSLFGEWGKPDVMFTEFIRVRPGSRKAFSPVDLLEATTISEEIPLVVQLIGKETSGLEASARAAQDNGAVHLNLNLGCPYGRMNSGSAGGALLKHPEGLGHRLNVLRNCIEGSFSVKVRSGYDDPEQIFSLLPFFEDSGVDFVVLHPRTVIQKYGGRADHELTARLVEKTRLPIIANGDVTNATEGEMVLKETGAAGLMIGRGAIRDPLIFERLRGNAARKPSREERAIELKYYITELAVRYQKIFQGESQALNKLKTILSMLGEDELFGKQVRKILRSNNLERFLKLLEKLA